MCWKYAKVSKLNHIKLELFRYFYQEKTELFNILIQNILTTMFTQITWYFIQNSGKANKTRTTLNPILRYYVLLSPVPNQRLLAENGLFMPALWSQGKYILKQY